MKPTTNFLIRFSAAILLLASSCTSMIECEQIETRHAFLIMDLSDKELFIESESDIKNNFPGFIQRTGLGSISACERFSLSFAHVGAQETLKISSDSIVLSRKGLSREEEHRLTSPAPIIRLIKNTLADYSVLTEDPAVNSSTTIANVLLKAINFANVESENVFLVFTDGVEYNTYLNLYKHIPENGHSELIKKLIEPSVLEAFRKHQRQGLQAKVIMVLKSEPTGKVDRRSIQQFWIDLFEELDLNYQFIDNLSNKIEL